LTSVRVASVSSATDTFKSTVVVDTIGSVDTIIETVSTFVDIITHVWIVKRQAGVCSESVGAEASVRTDSVGAIRECNCSTVVDSATLVDVSADIQVGVEMIANSTIAIV